MPLPVCGVNGCVDLDRPSGHGRCSGICMAHRHRARTPLWMRGVHGENGLASGGMSPDFAVRQLGSANFHVANVGVMPMAHTVRVRAGMIEKAMSLSGHRSDYSMAKAMGINRSTLARVRAGQLQPGPSFIAGALIALSPFQFCDLFEVVPRNQDVHQDGLRPRSEIVCTGGNSQSCPRTT
jgi:hypothetical protein